MVTCKKYEEGPRLSMRSKKARVANEWQYEKVTSPNGADMTAYFINHSIEFKKDGSYIGTEGTSSWTGTWQFASDKEDLVLTESGSGDAHTYRIIRLKNKALWFTMVTSNGVYEYHLSPK